VVLALVPALVAAVVPLPAAIGAAWAAPGTSTTSASPTTTAPPASTPTTTSPIVPLDSLILAQPLPGFTAAPAGPTNGPLSATEFASQSTSPAQAEQLFDSLGAEPGFGASIRLWNDLSGPGAGANDIAILLFRIPQPPQAQSFENGLNQPFDGTAGSTPFAVPSVPGAHGYTLSVTTPVKATEQVVVFAAGHYVAMVQLASSSAATNPDPLTPAQAIAVSYQELTTLTTGDPLNAGPAASSSTTAVPTTVVPTTTAPTANSSPTTTVPPGSTAGGAGGRSALREVAEGVGGVVLVGLVLVALDLVARRRRRSGPAGDPGRPDGDPWGPDGVFARFGARHTGGGEGSDDQGGRQPGDPLPRTVPELGLTESGAASG
jgi:hypothetical protein